MKSEKRLSDHPNMLKCSRLLETLFSIPLSASRQRCYSCSNTRLINILEAVPEGIDIVNQQFDIEYVNPEEDRNKVFDPFHTRKKPMGLGVGLSICHDIVKDHGGSIIAENSPASAAIFTIKLPTNQT